jgi:hypothetical protein
MHISSIARIAICGALIQFAFIFGVALPSPHNLIWIPLGLSAFFFVLPVIMEAVERRRPPAIERMMGDHGRQWVSLIVYDRSHAVHTVYIKEPYGRWYATATSCKWTDPPAWREIVAAVREGAPPVFGTTPRGDLWRVATATAGVESPWHANGASPEVSRVLRALEDLRIRAETIERGDHLREESQ